jgi:Flp pilus assembly protein TadG
MPGKRSKRQDQNGGLRAQALMEFALVLPILVLLVLGAMDLGRMFYTKTVITNAAREGANYLAYFPKISDVEGKSPDTVAYEIIYAEGDSSNVDLTDTDTTVITLSPAATSRLAGTSVSVTIQKTVDLIFDGPLQALGLISGPIKLTSEIKMVVQNEK